MEKKLCAGNVMFCLFFFSLLLAPNPALSFNQPAYNLGLTNCFDGAVPGPGLYMMAYTQFYGAQDIEVSSKMPEPVKTKLENTSVNSLAELIQIAYFTKQQLFGGFLGWNTVIPLVDISAKGGINEVVQSLPVPGTHIENNGGLGDIITGPVIQWVGKSLLGKPYFHRIELDVIVPSGRYSDEFLINPGSNIVTFNPYYSFTWMPLNKFETSFRIHYAWNSRNNSPYRILYGPNATLRPGQNFHFNYTMEYNPYKTFWMGLAGYCMWQLQEDILKDSAAPPELQEAMVQKEQVVGIGPLLTLQPIPNLIMSLATAFEVAVKNRPDGIKGTFKILYKFW
jgi:anthranilate 1,2-dioxygenase (deaminating, decarboxylating) large subunit